MTTAILQDRLSGGNFVLNPHMLATMQRVKQAGLHRVTAQMYGVEEVCLKTAAAHLGVKLVNRRRSHMAKMAGLQALRELHGDGVVKLAFDKGQVVTTTGGLVNKGSKSLFAAFDDKAAKGFDAAKTMRGSSVGKLPSINKLPTAP
jgi:hypothetical protein